MSLRLRHSRPRVARQRPREHLPHKDAEVRRRRVVPIGDHDRTSLRVEIPRAPGPVVVLDDLDDVQEPVVAGGIGRSTETARPPVGPAGTADPNNSPTTTIVRRTIITSPSCMPY